ncbi:WXG100 family type VII secretion target [Mycolicibacterium sp.]|uniref:WXG100 family type VII secretion target n=1 Tax=Mycolicibacterium sp. TaxID=2320850 RepID=UPI0037C72A56
MTGLVGADVDQLRALARTLIQAADRLESSVASVTGTLSAVRWSGPDGERFRSQWHSESQAKLRSVVAALRDTSNTLSRNADEQDRASAAGSAGVPVSTMAAPSQWAPGFPGLSGTQPLNPLAGIRDFLNSNAAWPITWGTALGGVDGVGVLPLLDALGLAGDSRLGPDEKMSEAAEALVGLGAGQLKDKGAVGYLSGVALQQWTDVAILAGQADFSAPGLTTVTDYLATDPGGAFDAAKDAVIGYVPKLFSNLLPW